MKRGIQVQPPAVHVFGIELESSGAQADELAELIQFACMCNERKVAGFVKRATYDSDRVLCVIECQPEIDERQVAATVILDVAKATLARFEWFGTPQIGDTRCICC